MTDQWQACSAPSAVKLVRWTDDGKTSHDRQDDEESETTPLATSLAQQLGVVAREAQTLLANAAISTYVSQSTAEALAMQLVI